MNEYRPKLLTEHTSIHVFICINFSMFFGVSGLLLLLLLLLLVPQGGPTAKAFIMVLLFIITVCTVFIISITN